MTAGVEDAEIVAVAPDRVEELAEVHAEAFPRPWSALELARMLGGPGAFGLAIASGPFIAGFILVRTLAGEAEVLTLAVRRASRRHGAGRALVEAAVAAATVAGARAMLLEAAVDNIPALALYGEAGFEAVGRRRAYYARPSGGAVDALVMRRVLNSDPL